MSWFKVDDGFYSDPKVMSAPPLAIALWVTAGSWASRHLTDGFVPDHVLPMFRVTRAEADALVTAGLWHECDGGWTFHDWADYQPSREKVLSDREAARERMRRRRSGERSPNRDDGSTGVRANTERTSREVRQPSVRDPRPDPTRPDHSSSSAKPPAVAKPPREDVEELCTRLRDHVARNTDKPPTITTKWRTEARLLLDKDGIKLEEAVRVLDWCQHDSFWKSNILSMPKFREKFAQLQIKSRQSSERGNTNDAWSTPKGYDPADWLRPSNEPAFDYIDAEVVQLREIGR